MFCTLVVVVHDGCLGAPCRAVRVSPLGRGPFRGAGPHQQPNAQRIEHRRRVLHGPRLRAVSLEGLAWPAFCLCGKLVSGNVSSLCLRCRTWKRAMIRAFIVWQSLLMLAFSSYNCDVRAVLLYFVCWRLVCALKPRGVPRSDDDQAAFGRW